jgi:hypothetical protein
LALNFVPGPEGLAERPLITVLGSRTAVAEYAGREGFNVFNFAGVAEADWARTNAQLLNAALQRGDQIWLVTNPALHAAALQRAGISLESSYYLSLELPMLREFGAVAVPKY